MKKTISFILTAALCSLASLPTSAQENSNSVKFDFESGSESFLPIFADYPSKNSAADFYELKADRRDVPIDNSGKGMFISGNNHSDDLFMGYYKELDNFKPNMKFKFDLSFKLATNIEGGLMGIGGSPGASVYVKYGITSQKPEITTDSLGNYRLNIDKGNQGIGGTDMLIAGTIEKQHTTEENAFEFNTYHVETEAVSNNEGQVFLILGTDSGFEGTTSYYIDDVNISWSEKEVQNQENDIAEAISLGIIDNSEHNPNSYITREQFCEMAYNMANLTKELPSVKMKESPFDDTMNYKINSLYFSEIISGKGERTFAPEDTLTREEAAVILCRIAKYTDTDIPLAKVETAYSDNDTISPWALSYVYSLKLMGVMDSDSESFNPKQEVTYSQAVSSLLRLYKYINS